MPFKILGTAGIRNHRTRIAFDVIVLGDFIKDRPTDGTAIEGIEDDIAWLTETGVVTAIRIGDHGAIAATQCASQHFGNRNGLARLGGATDQEMQPLDRARYRHAGQRDLRAQPFAETRFPFLAV